MSYEELERGVSGSGGIVRNRSYRVVALTLAFGGWLVLTSDAKPTTCQQADDSFVPESSDLIKLGICSNIMMHHLTQSGKLFLDAVDFQSKAHAQSAIDYMEKSNYKTSLNRALDQISRWPQGTYKDKARKLATALSKLYSTIISAHSNVANEEYARASKDMDSAKRTLEGALDDLIYLFTARGIPDWEERVKKEIYLSDKDGVYHTESCKVGNAQLKASDESGQKASEEAIQKAIKEKRWTQRQLDRIVTWIKQRPGTRGACPLDLPDYLKEAFIPKFIFVLQPVSVEEAKTLKKCPSCIK